MTRNVREYYVEHRPSCERCCTAPSAAMSVPSASAPGCKPASPPSPSTRLCASLTTTVGSNYKEDRVVKNGLTGRLTGGPRRSRKTHDERCWHGWWHVNQLLPPRTPETLKLQFSRRRTRRRQAGSSTMQACREIRAAAAQRQQQQQAAASAPASAALHCAPSHFVHLQGDAAHWHIRKSHLLVKDHYQFGKEKKENEAMQVVHVVREQVPHSQDKRTRVGDGVAGMRRRSNEEERVPRRRHRCWCGANRPPTARRRPKLPHHARSIVTLIRRSERAYTAQLLNPAYRLLSNTCEWAAFRFQSFHAEAASAIEATEATSVGFKSFYE